MFTYELDSSTALADVTGTSLWLTKPRFVRFTGTHDRSYFVYLDYTNTKIMAGYWDHTLNAFATPVEVATAPAQDAHCSPSLFINAAGYPYVSWAGWSGGAGDGKGHLKKSAAAESIATWGSDLLPVSGDEDCNYTRTLVLSDGTLACFYEKGVLDLYRKLSHDDGANWDHEQMILDTNDTNLYFQAILGDSDRVHIAYATGDSASLGYRSPCYIYSDNAGADTSTWKNAAGSTQTLPLVHEAATCLVYDSDGAGWDNAYLMALTFGASNKPYLLCKLQDVASFSRVVCFEYSGAAWNMREVLRSPRIGTPSDSYPGIGDGDLWVSGTTLRAVFTLSIGGHDEVHERGSSDDAVTWYKINNRTASTATHCYAPSYPRGPMPADYPVLYFVGADNYNTAKTLNVSRVSATKEANRELSFVSDKTKIPADLAGFTAPLMVTTSEVPTLAEAQADGDDFVVTTAAGVRLPHILESWDGTALIVHLKFDADKDADQTYKLSWGCATCASHQDLDAAFDENWIFASGMAGASTTIADLTVRAHTGTKKAAAEPEEVDALLGKGQHFDDTDDYVTLGDHDEFSFGNGTADSPFTLLAWINLDGATDTGGIISKYTSLTAREYVFYVNAGKLALICIDESSDGYIGRYYNTALATGAWINVGGVYSGAANEAAIDLYLAGAVVDDTAMSGGAYGAMENLTAVCRLGIFTTSEDLTLNGRMNMVSIHKTNRSANWILALKNAQGVALVGATGGFWKSYSFARQWVGTFNGVYKPSVVLGIANANIASVNGAVG
jgi:hypothetical protein